MSTEDRKFLQNARDAYVRANTGTLEWLLGRPRLHHAFLNTKQDSITLRDYSDDDGWRGPKILYGWIQGRGLEALVRHTRFFDRESPELAAQIQKAARLLYEALAELYGRYGHAYFSYDAQLNPVYPGPNGELRKQRPVQHLYTYSDVFALKGLIAASACFEPTATIGHVRALSRVVQAIEDGRFVTNERQPLREEVPTCQAGDYGPRMILLGAAALLREIGLNEEAAFGARFIEHVLLHHVENGRGQLPSGATHDVPGQDHCNPGHAAEFAGLALEYLPPTADPALVEDLERMLLTSFELGFSSPGLYLSVSLAERTPLSEYLPWWSLPETVRAAAIAYSRTGNPAALDVWRRAHAAFFEYYWRGDPPIAYQTQTTDGPVDYVPATPDLDPGYHTGLSFLGAINAIDRLLLDDVPSSALGAPGHGSVGVARGHTPAR